jgi:hypothetical protein
MPHTLLFRGHHLHFIPSDERNIQLFIEINSSIDARRCEGFHGGERCKQEYQSKNKKPIHFPLIIHGQFEPKDIPESRSCSGIKRMRTGVRGEA